MLPEFKTVKDIADWMDDKAVPLQACNQGKTGNYCRQEFLMDLISKYRQR